MKKKALLFSVALLLCMAMLVAACAAPAPETTPEITPPTEPEVEVFEWDMQTLLPAGMPMQADLFGAFADSVRAASGGRLDITVHPAGTIVGTFEMFDAVSDGVFEVYMANPVYWSGKDAGFAALGSPTMGFPEVWQFDAWYRYGGGLELAQKLYAEYNLHFLPINYGPDSIHSKIRLSSVEDFEGIKIRSPQGMPADLFAKLGAAVTVVPGGEVYSSMEKGIIEAAEWGSPDLHHVMGWHEVTDYIIYPAFHQLTNGNEITVNMDAWQELPDDLKAIFTLAVEELNIRMDEYMSYRDYTAMKEMVEYGNEWVEMPAEELAKIQPLAVEVWDGWAAMSPAANEIIESQIAFMRLLKIIE